MIGPSPLAYYDSLAITAKLTPAFEKTAISEVHLFAYLACLLALYRGNPVAVWGYDFIATENGSPFSAEIDDCLRILIRKGFVTESERYLKLTKTGEKEYLGLQELSQNRTREEFIEAACSCVLAMPLGVIRSAVTNDHDMQIAKDLQDTRRLLGSAAVETLHDAFGTLSKEIGADIKDLIVPAVVWLRFLSLADKKSASNAMRKF